MGILLATMDQPFRFKGTIDYDIAADYTVCDLKTGANRASDPRSYAFFDTSDNADISYEITGGRLSLITVTAIEQQDMAKLQAVAEGLYLEVGDGVVTRIQNLGEAVGYPAKINGVSYVDSDLSAGGTKYAYTRESVWIDFDEVLNFNLKSTKVARLRATAAATGTVLPADCLVRLDLLGKAWKGSDYNQQTVATCANNVRQPKSAPAKGGLFGGFLGGRMKGRSGA